MRDEAVSPPIGNRFDRFEVAGAFGDLGTLVPFVVAYLAVLKMDPFGVLFAFGGSRCACLAPEPLEAAPGNAGIVGDEREHSWGGYACNQKSGASENGLHHRNAYDSPRYVTDGRASELHQILAALTKDAADKGTQRIDQLWFSGEQEPCNYDGDEKFEQRKQCALCQDE